MAGGHERRRSPWTATRQTLVDFVAKHAGTLEPLHDHRPVLPGVVPVVEPLTGFVRVENRDANHVDLLLPCTIVTDNWKLIGHAAEPRMNSRGFTRSPRQRGRVPRAGLLGQARGRS